MTSWVGDALFVESSIFGINVVIDKACIMQVLVGLLACAALACGARLLVVFPAPSRSHHILGQSVVDTMLAEGHEVTFVTPFPKDDNNTSLKYVDIKSAVEESKSKGGLEKPSLERLAHTPRPIHKVLQIGGSFANAVLAHPGLRTLLEDPAVRYDGVIAEWFFSGLLAPLAAVFECPLVWYTSQDANWMTLRLVHESSSAAYGLEALARAAPAQPFSMVERAHQLWLQTYMSAWIYYQTHFVEAPLYHELYERAFSVRGRTLPDYEELVHNASLLLANSHPPLGQRLPLPLSVKLVGGHHVQTPIEPLPQDLQTLLDNAKNGAIFFSMGSNLRSSDFPPEMKRELVEVLGQLEQTVLWKFEEQLDHLPGNLHILDWAPQTSILKHSNTVLFITHGGLLSLTEATLCGVPVVGVPLYGDQFVNMDLVSERGAGLRVDISPDLPRRLKRAVNDILADHSYRERAARAAFEFSARVAPPQRELAHWVRLVLDTRGAAHLRSPALALSPVERLHADVALLAALLLWFLFKVLKLVCVYRAVPVDNTKKDQ